MRSPVTERADEAPAAPDAAARMLRGMAEALKSASSLLVLGAVFFLLVTPVALILRFAGRRPLDLGFEPGRQSYWIERRPPGPPPDSMSRPF